MTERPIGVTNLATPILVASYPNVSMTGTSRSVAGVSWASGDLIVVKGDTADNASITLSAPTNANLTLTSVAGFPSNIGSQTKEYCWTATAASDQTGQTIAGSVSTSGRGGGYVVEVWRNHGGVGAIRTPVQAAGGTTVSTTITTTGANSALSCGCGDWAAVAVGATPYGTGPGPATNEFKQQFSGEWSPYFWYHADAGAIGSKTIAVTSTGTIDPMIWAIEILGPSGAGIVKYRTRERSVAGDTVCEQYLIPTRERVPSFRGMASDFWAGNSSTGAAKCGLNNLATSNVLVAVRACMLVIVPWATASIPPTEFRVFLNPGSIITGGAAVLAKVSVGTGADTAQTSDAGVELRSRSLADAPAGGGVALTVTLGNAIAYRQSRPYSVDSQMLPMRGIYPPADNNTDYGDNLLDEFASSYPVILRPGDSIATWSAGANTNKTMMGVNWLWDEYTLP